MADEKLRGLVRDALKAEAARLYTEASEMEIPNLDPEIVSKFYELTGRAERIERAIRRGGWYCILGHLHDLTEERCLAASLLLTTGEPGVVEVVGSARTVVAVIEGEKKDA